MSEKREPTRAELVRARRAQRYQQGVLSMTGRSVKPMATVTSRAGSMYVQNLPKRNPRRFSLPIDLRSFAVYKPSTREALSHSRWRMLSATFSLVLGIAIYLAWTLPYFRVASAEVAGNHRLGKNEIDAVLGVAGQSIFLIHPQEMATRLRLNYPELDSAVVKIQFPNRVVVNVTERQPVILWQQGDGFTWIDPSGVAFRPRGIVPGLVPVVGLSAPPAADPIGEDPLSPPRFMREDLVQAVLTLAPSVPAGSILTYDPHDGLGWADGRGWDVFFGNNPSGMSMKVRVYQSLVESLEQRGIYPVYINVGFAEAPYYRLGEFSTVEINIESGQ